MARGPYAQASPRRGRLDRRSRVTRNGTSAANTALTVTIEASSGRRVLLNMFRVVVRGAAVAADAVVTVREQDAAGERRWVDVLGVGSPQGTATDAVWDGALEFPPSQAVVLVVPALGAGAIAEAVLEGWYGPEEDDCAD